MTESKRPVYCGSCGSLASSEDRFCGTCGAVIPSDAQEAAPTDEIPTLVSEPQGVQPGGGSRRTMPWALGIGLLLVLLVGTGAVAYAAFGPGIDLIGGSEPDPAQPTTTEETAPPEEETQEDNPSTSPEPPTQEPTTMTPPVPADAAPDPAFDRLLPTLQQRTSAPIMLPAELPDELDKPAIDASLSGKDEYRIVFPFGPTSTIAKDVSNAETLGTLSTQPEGKDRANEFFDAESIEKIMLPDGTEATLRYMVPAGRSGSQGPFWEGKFDKNGYTYDLTIIKPNEITEDEVKQTLSTMVLVRGSVDKPSTPPSPNQPSGTNASKAKAEEAAGDYYRAAGSQDWSYTYDHLDSTTKSRFSRAEWRKKNQWFADNNPAVYYIESVELDSTSQRPLAEVEVRLTGEDGSSSIRNTYFVFEDGEWLHRFAQEEIDLFGPGVSFEEWVDD